MNHQWATKAKEKKYTILLLLILLFAFLIRVNFFIETRDQTLWWDEAEYMAVAKHFAMDTPFRYNPQRPPLFQYIAAGFFLMGASEALIKFTLVVIPSTLLVLLIYLLGKEMYNQKVGLIAAFLASVHWSFLFWTARMQPDSFSMVFQVAAIWCAWRYWKEGKTKFMLLVGFLTAIALMFKVSALIVPLILFVFVFLKERFEMFKRKEYYASAAIFVITLIPYFLWSYAKFGTPLGFKRGYSNAFLYKTSFGWYNLKFFYLMTENLLFILFIAGLILGLRWILYGDVLIKEKKRCFNPDMFSILSLIMVSAFYIFYVRGTEDRWVFLWMPFIFYLAANALISVEKVITNINPKKMAGTIGLLILLGGVGYMQIEHAANIIKQKLPTYAEVRDGGLWIKQNSNKGDTIISQSPPQIAYYSEREVFGIEEEQAVFEAFIREKKPNFVHVSIFEHHPDWIGQWLEKEKDALEPVWADFLNEEKSKVTSVIYRVHNEKFS